MPNIRKFENREFHTDECSTLYRIEFNMDTGKSFSRAITVWESMPTCHGNSYHWEANWGDIQAAAEYFGNRYYSVSKFTPINGVNRKTIKKSVKLK